MPDIGLADCEARKLTLVPLSSGDLASEACAQERAVARRRAGVQAMAAMNDRAFLTALGGVPTLKAGWPKAD
jgi:hypothetical protein